jgi:hypothetical protein
MTPPRTRSLGWFIGAGSGCHEQMRIDAKNVDLSPGMAIVVEIKTGQRRLIEYFLSPLIEAAAESAPERS